MKKNKEMYLDLSRLNVLMFVGFCLIAVGTDYTYIIQHSITEIQYWTTIIMVIPMFAFFILRIIIKYREKVVKV